MRAVLSWVSNVDKDFTARAFWEKIQALFNNEKTTSQIFTSVEADSQLIIWAQRISQFVLIAKWADLREEDIKLIVDRPSWLGSEYAQTPLPSLNLLLALSRLKEWQQRVQVSIDEGMQYFSTANDQETTESIINLLARMHGWEISKTSAMIAFLFPQGYPKNFEQVFQLETWMSLSARLHVGSKTLRDLLIMSQQDNDAEETGLLESVAFDLMAGVENQAR
jgi:hypothetical protein